MTAEEKEEFVGLFFAALQAVAPEVTVDQRMLVKDVLDGMLKERAAMA